MATAIGDDYHLLLLMRGFYVTAGREKQTSAHQLEEEDTQIDLRNISG